MSRSTVRPIVVALALAVATATVSTGEVTLHEPTTNSWAPVVWLSPGFPIVSGSSSVLRRTSDVATMHIASSGFAPDTVVTAWWVVFNYPLNCTHPNTATNSLCGGPDIANPATGTTYQWADGQVVHEEGEVALKASLAVGDSTHCASAALPCVGLLDVGGAEYHIALRSMGPIVPSLLSAQLTTLNGGCQPGEPNAGRCANVQGAAHLGR
jgi:hypothetical protein